MNLSNIARTVTLAAASVGLVLAAANTSGATADTATGDNAYTWGEFMDSTFAGQPRGNVQGPYVCDCTGYVADKFSGADGHLRKLVIYPDGEDSSVYITYRVDQFGTYRVTQRMFATDGVGYNVPFTD